MPAPSPLLPSLPPFPCPPTFLPSKKRLDKKPTEVKWDVTQAEKGDMVIGFRYRLDAVMTDMSVKIDGVAYDAEGENQPIEASILNGWWNYIFTSTHQDP